MKKHQVIIAVGSNIEPERHVSEAGRILEAEQRLIGRSAFRRTTPVGFTDQAAFLNGAFLIETDLDPVALKAYLKEVEQRLGRVRGPIRSGPRTIDLDITVWDGQIVHEDYHAHSHTRIPVDELLHRFQISVASESES